MQKKKNHWGEGHFWLRSLPGPIWIGASFSILGALNCIQWWLRFVWVRIYFSHSWSQHWNISKWEKFPLLILTFLASQFVRNVIFHPVWALGYCVSPGQPAWRLLQHAAKEWYHTLSILGNYVRIPDTFLKSVETQADWSSLVVISSFQEWLPKPNFEVLMNLVIKNSIELCKELLLCGHLIT